MEKREKKTKEKYHLSLFGWVENTKERKWWDPVFFYPDIPKCISLNWTENWVESEWKNPNDFFTLVPCCLSLAKVVFLFWMPRTFFLLNTTADMKREFEHWEAAGQYC